MANFHTNEEWLNAELHKLHPSTQNILNNDENAMRVWKILKLLQFRGASGFEQIGDVTNTANIRDSGSLYHPLNG